MTATHSQASTESFPGWLDKFASEDGVSLISPNRPYMFSETEYDSYYNDNDPSNEASGKGVVNLIRLCGGDFGGPVLELGCGSGKMTVGLCRTGAFPHYLITDGSRAFLDLTKDKLIGYGSGVGKVRFATLLDADMNSLPDGSLSAIVMRSVLHHFLDVPGFIKKTAPTLRPGGSLIFQEPCAGGYLLMGLLARMLEGEIGHGLTDALREKAQRMAETMAAYHRVDIDKTDWEDKHIFRPEQIQEWAQSAGLITRYFSNHQFEDFAHTPVYKDGLHFHKFMEDYMNYCMGFGATDAAAMMQPLKPYTEYLLKGCGGTREPQLMGVFVLQRPAVPGAH